MNDALGSTQNPSRHRTDAAVPSSHPVRAGGTGVGTDGDTSGPTLVPVVPPPQRAGLGQGHKASSVLGWENGVPIVAVTLSRFVCRRGRVSLLLLLARCPYCGRRHQHGAGDRVLPLSELGGHRLSHCELPVRDNPGYVLRVVGEETASRGKAKRRV